MRLQHLCAASALVIASGLCPLAHAQAPPAAPSNVNRAPAARNAQPDTRNAAGANPASQGSPAPLRRRSIVHHYPYPYPEYYHGDQTAGFRNPGGLGRYAEYYPAGSQAFQGPSQGGQDPVRPAQFDVGGGHPTQAEHLQALQLGVQKNNQIMQHIDNYARPYYGFGVGYFGGFN